MAVRSSGTSEPAERQGRKTKQAETDGKTAENGGTLENYDSEMNGAFNKSQEAAEAAKKEEAKEEDFGSGEDGGFSDGESNNAKIRSRQSDGSER